MSSLSATIEQYMEARIDFVGQQLVGQILRVVLITATIISFIAGFVLQSLTVTFSIFGASTLVLAFVLLPAWPIFNRYPVKWLPVIEEEGKKS